MARTGLAHTTREVATRLASGYVFAAEFLELGLGDEREKEWHRGGENAEAVHGAAIVARRTLERPVCIHLDGGGTWFDGAEGQRRVGGRIAVAATIRITGRPVAVVSVHLESNSSPEDRARQMGALLTALDSYAPDMPVVMGGDFNTCTAVRDPFWGPEAKRPLVLEDPDRLVDPIAYEPLFELAADAGYDWERCNVLGAVTMRTRPDGTPAPPLGKIDWFFTRGLVAADPEVVAAVDGDGATAISDHELLAVTVSPKMGAVPIFVK
jgi:endonuclease/exonuclease/phosphatase family metal-dependent hydrolase